MKENIINRANGKTDWKKLKSMSEKEIVKNAIGDIDAPLLTDAELSGFKRAVPASIIDVKKIRTNLRMTQESFSQYFGFNLKTLRDWEQHRRAPSGAARNLLKVIEIEPKIVQRALSQD